MVGQHPDFHPQNILVVPKGITVLDFTSFRYGNRYYDRGYRNYRRHGHYDSGSFLGGLVLGSLLSYPRYPSYSSRNYDTVTYSSLPVSRSRKVVYVNRTTTPSTAAVASGRRLLRDLEGNCFEREIDEQGNEVRIQLEAEACNF